MTAWALTAFNLALFVAMIGLLLYGRPYLALVASVLGAVGGVAYGIIAHFPLGIALGIVNILLWLWFWWWSRRRRKPVSKAIGDESRQLRDGLVRRMRQRRVTRPGWSPSR